MMERAESGGCLGVGFGARWAALDDSDREVRDGQGGAGRLGRLGIREGSGTEVDEREVQIARWSTDRRHRSEMLESVMVNGRNEKTLCPVRPDPVLGLKRKIL